MMKERKNNNKGFTLVELIIVVAVMAVLAIVVSPQLIKYIETSRRATDRDTIWAVARAAQIAYGTTEEFGDDAVLVSIDAEGNAQYGKPLSNISFGEGVEVTIDTSDYVTLLDDEVKTVVPESSYQYKSELYRNSDIKIYFEDQDATKLKIVANGEVEYLRGKLSDKQDDLNDEGAILGATNTVVQALEKYEVLDRIGESSWNSFVMSDGPFGTWKSIIDAEQTTLNWIGIFLSEERKAQAQASITEQTALLEQLRSYGTYDKFEEACKSDLTGRIETNASQSTAVGTVLNNLNSEETEGRANDLGDHINEVLN